MSQLAASLRSHGFVLFFAITAIASTLQADESTRTRPNLEKPPASPGVSAFQDVAAKNAVQIVDRRGEPVEGARVEIFRVPRSTSLFAVADLRIAQGTTNEDGALDATLPELDTAVALVDSPRHLPLVVEGTPRPGVRLALAEGRSIDLRILVPKGEIADQTKGRACARWTLGLERVQREREIERCAEIRPTDETGALPESVRILGVPRASSESPVDVEVQLEGFLPWHGRVKSDTDRLEATLEPGVLISGRLEDPEGHGVVDARVRSGSDAEATSDDEGRFAVAVRALPAALEITADGFRPLTRTLRELPEKGPVVTRLEWSEGVRFELVSGGAELDSKEVPKVFAEAFHPPSSWRLHRTEPWSAEPGWGVDLPGDGLYRLRIEWPGHRPVLTDELQVGRGELVDLGVLELEQGAGVRGLVLDPDEGEGLSGVHLRLVLQGTGVLQQLRRGGAPATTTDTEGRFALSGVEPGRYTLHLEREGFAPATREIELEVDERRDLGEILLDRGVRVAGRVFDRAEAPKAGVRVRVLPSPESLEPLAEATTNAAGEFSGLDLAPGSYRVEVWDERLLLAQPVTLHDEPEVDLELEVGGIRWSGRVTYGGAPVQGGRLSAVAVDDPGRRRGKMIVNTAGGLAAPKAILGAAESRRNVELGADGEFTFDGIEPGPVSVTYTSAAGLRSTLEIAVPDRADAWTPLDFLGSTLAGAVIEPESGIGVPAEVRLFGDAGQWLGSAETDAAGEFLFRDLQPDGVYTLEARAEGYRTALLPEVRLEESGQDVTIRLEPGEDGHLRVDLRRADGSPLGYAFVTLLSEAGATLRSLPADPYGRIDFGSLPAGRYLVVWSDPVVGTGATETFVEAPGRVERTLQRGVDVELACGDPTSCGGMAVAGLAVYSTTGHEIGSYLPGLSTSMRFSADGRLPLGRLTPGRYLVRALVRGQNVDRWVRVEGARTVVSLVGPAAELGP